MPGANRVWLRAADSQGGGGAASARAALAQRLSQDPEVTNRLIQQALYFFARTRSLALQIRPVIQWGKTIT